MTRPEERERRNEEDELTLPLSNRRGESQPVEFADDLRANRFTPPPDPPAPERKTE